MSDIPDDFEDDFQTLAKSRKSTTPAARAIRVQVASGPDAGANILIDGSGPGRWLVGTSEACQLRLTDKTVSRRHLALEVEGNEIRVSDLGSLNGTRVGNLRIVEAIVDADATIALGDTMLHMHAESGRPALLPSQKKTFGCVRGGSLAMRRLYPLCERLAATTIPVVVEGETGTGKEAMAEALHQMGPRADRPFVVFDCTAVPANLVEAELFGHTKGAFTGAGQLRKGVFEEANGGTLLIDEIGDLDLSLQPKLLRAIDRSEIRPIGSNTAIRVDVRIIAATRRDLDKEVQAGRFRDDLFHRLAVGRLELPPLRKRRGDVEELARHFWQSLGGGPDGPDPEMLARWKDHSWPGNVRELRNTVSRHVALGDIAQYTDKLEPPPPEEGSDEAVVESFLAAMVKLPLSQARQRLNDVFERLYVERTLQKHGGNVTHAAKHAGVARRYMQILKARTKGE